MGIRQYPSDKIKYKRPETPMNKGFRLFLQEKRLKSKTSQTLFANIDENARKNQGFQPFL